MKGAQPLALAWLALVLSARGAPTAQPTATETLQFRTPWPAQYTVQWPEPRTKTTTEQPEWISGIELDLFPGLVEFGRRIVLQLEPGESLELHLADRPLQREREIVPGVFLLEAADATMALRQALELSQRPGVRTCYPIMRRQAELANAYARAPNDFFFLNQWPLEHRRSDGTRAGVDLNVRAAWPYTRGAGVTLAVVDLGVDLQHPELVQRAAGGPHYNFAENTTNGSPVRGTVTFAHGTEVAGLAVAEANNRIGIAGVAPEAHLASWIIYQSNLVLTSDDRLMAMYQHASNRVHVQNHSWTRSKLGQNGPTLLEQIGISNAWTFGRSNRGSILIRTAGNDRDFGGNANDDAYSSDPHAIAVGSVRTDGRVTTYSEPGACLLLAAPSGDSGFPLLVTTDLVGTRGVNQINFLPPNTNMNDYVFNDLGFTGTSASAPLVSGVAALILAVNPDLTYRDVQQILLLSARHFDFADPDLNTNAAGLRVSHNVGFGIPDAATAVQLAQSWSNRPPASSVSANWTGPAAIPDPSLQLILMGSAVPAELATLPCLPGTGPFPDDSTVTVPLVEVGTAQVPVASNLTGKAALIQRSGSNWARAITNAANAGALFAVVYNNATGDADCPGGETLCPMLRTDFVPIPAVFIRRSDGEALKALAAEHPDTLAQIRFVPTNIIFEVTNTLVCEHVAVRMQTDHALRGDLRITLVSPNGTRSVLQRLNQDTNAGPVDWTYYSTHHFYENSAGTWTLAVGDQFRGGAGSLLQATLTLTGVPIHDADRDGLADGWEEQYFAELSRDGLEDTDRDGRSNSQEQVLGTDPQRVETPLHLDLAPWNQRLLRLSWPSTPYATAQVFSAEQVGAPLVELTNLPPRFPVNEWFVAWTNSAQRFFRVLVPHRP